MTLEAQAFGLQSDSTEEHVSRRRMFGRREHIGVLQTSHGCLGP